MTSSTIKALCAAALAACAATSAQAQSNVTVYGVLDMYMEYGKGDITTKKIQSGGLSGSRLGFKGTEDLGDGLKALFQIENGFAADTGQVTQGGVFWGRQALVGLSGGFGSLTMGRQYLPQFIALDTDDPFDTGAGSAISSGIVSLLGVRGNNSIVYEAPGMGGLSFSVMASAGEGVAPRMWSSAVRYSAGAASVSLSATSLNTPDTSRAVALSGSYNFGAVQLLGGVQQVKNLTGALNVNDDRSEYWVGAIMPVGQWSFNVGYGSGKTKDVDGTHASQISAGALYALSKRTSFYGVLTQVNNDVHTAYSPDTATGAGPSVSAGVDARALQVGIRHRF